MMGVSHCGCSSVVERQLPKLNVDGSSPFTRFSPELRFGDGPPAAFAQARKDREKSRIEHTLEDQRRWVEESMTTEPAPCIKIIAVLKGG